MVEFASNGLVDAQTTRAGRSLSRLASSTGLWIPLATDQKAPRLRRSANISLESRACLFSNKLFSKMLWQFPLKVGSAVRVSVGVHLFAFRTSPVRALVNQSVAEQHQGCFLQTG